MNIDLSSLTISKARTHLLNGDFTAFELTKSYLNNIDKKNKHINAYVEVFDDALLHAERADKEIKEKKNDAPPLAGIPFAIKDNILIKGRTVSCGSNILKNYKATYDATAIAKLKDAKAVFLGRGNMDEFAMGSSTERSIYGPTRNPHDPAFSSGGSSGGPAAAVSMDGALAALGSDTGGSVRQPASFCGIVGLKPTYGAVSRYGLVAMASSFDQIGPLAKTVEDAEIVFNAIKGKDRLDSTSIEIPSHKPQATNHKLRVGVPSFLFEKETPLEKNVLKNFNDSLDVLKEGGYDVKEVEMQFAKYALPIYYIIMPAEASTNLARFDGVRYGLHKEGKDVLGDYTHTRGEGFGAEVRRRILLGTYVLSSGYHDAYYRKAVSVQNIMTAGCRKIFADVDVIATPTSPTPAFPLGERLEDPVTMYLSDIFTVIANIVGFPAISIPSGEVLQNRSSLPLGLQLMARHGREDVLFAVGTRFEELRTL